MEAEALLRSRVSHKTRMESVSEFVQQVAHDPDGCVACAVDALLAERDEVEEREETAMVQRDLAEARVEALRNTLEAIIGIDLRSHPSEVRDIARAALAACSGRGGGESGA